MVAVLSVLDEFTKHRASKSKRITGERQQRVNITKSWAHNDKQRQLE